MHAPEELKIWVDACAGTGEPVHWIAEGGVYAYPYQLITYRMEGSKICGDVEQGVAPRVRKIKSKAEMPFWLKPLADIEEVRALQQDKEGKAWAK